VAIAAVAIAAVGSVARVPLVARWASALALGASTASPHTLARPIRAEVTFEPLLRSREVGALCTPPFRYHAASMAEPIKVVVAGFGRLGGELARGLAQSAEIDVVGIARRSASESVGTIDVADQRVPVSAHLGRLIERTHPQVLLEASLPGAAVQNVTLAIEAGVAPVIATSGIDDAALEEIKRACAARGVGGVVAPNLSLGAVLLIHLCAIAGRFFDSADVIEMHRDAKLDAPSGTALHTARVMADARGKPFTRAETERFTLDDVRGGAVEGIGIHSIRLPGLVAHQQVIFGGLGQTLTLRHDTSSNESYVPGAIMAIRHAATSPAFAVGLASLLGLQ
jgi:4-hydroxy-tetrahydrodipicolinate reductase